MPRGRTATGPRAPLASTPASAGTMTERRTGNPMILTALDDIRPGMVLGVGVRNKEGHTLLGPGVELTESYVDRLRDLGYCAMWIDTEDTSDIPYQDMLTESTRLS